MKNVIVISAHPDDEIIGAGGSILKHVAMGDNVFWLIVTNISESSGQFKKERVASRQEEIEKVAQMVGIKKTFKLEYPTMSLSSSSIIKMVPEISAIFMETQPEIVYCLNRSDAHSDHRITFDAVMACTKSFRYPFLKRVLLYECISETEFAPALAEKVFLPNYFVDISAYFSRKIEILSVYQSELGEHPFPRSIRNIEALAVHRGAIAGVEYAEAFQLIKYIDK
ncbi:PIG-L deacetylase family protein [Taibaiella koreensis]|uniref:PIG-L deacetylase family protein n=1 Tax=Taibaiella koreensis TaxID=1268548 RepID=UPI000E59C433|nr:PIG-L deacetylase family protein [Taibaiella koreensis]